MTHVAPESDVAWTMTVPSTVTYPQYAPTVAHTGSTLNNGNTTPGNYLLGVSSLKMFDGQVNFNFSSTNSTISLGLATADASGYTAYNFALYNNAGSVKFVLNGVATQDCGIADPKIVYAIERENGKINVRKDGKAIYTVAVPEDDALQSGQQAINNLKVSVYAKEGPDCAVRNVYMTGAK